MTCHPQKQNYKRIATPPGEDQDKATANNNWWSSAVWLLRYEHIYSRSDRKTAMVVKYNEENLLGLGPTGSLNMTKKQTV